MPRLFIGSFLSDEGIAKLIDLPESNRGLGDLWNAKIRWSDRIKLHITWVFLGDVETNVIPNIISALEPAISDLDLVNPPPRISYDKFELWPNEREAKHAVVTPQSVADDILKIKDAIKNAVDQYVPASQMKHEYKVFRPHVTVFRLTKEQSHSGKRSSRPRISDINLSNSMFPIHQTIDEIHLIESHLNTSPSTYDRLATFRLNPR